MGGPHASAAAAGSERREELAARACGPRALAAVCPSATAGPWPSWPVAGPVGAPLGRSGLDPGSAVCVRVFFVFFVTKNVVRSKTTPTNS